MTPSPAAAATGPVRRRRQAVDGRAARNRIHGAIHGAWHRDDGRLGPPVRRRIGRAVGRTIPGAVAVLAAAAVARGGFARPGVGLEEWGVLLLLCAAASSATLRAVRRSAEGRPARIGEQLEIGAIFVVGAAALAQLSSSRGGEGPLFPLVYLTAAVAVSFLSLPVGLALVALAAALQLGVWWTSGAPDGDLPGVLARVGFILLFAVLYHAVLWARLAAARRNEREAVDRRLRDLDERAREMRLLSPRGMDRARFRRRGAGAPAGPGGRRPGRGGHGRGHGGRRGGPAQPHLRALPPLAGRRHAEAAGVPLGQRPGGAPAAPGRRGGAGKRHLPARAAAARRRHPLRHLLRGRDASPGARGGSARRPPRRPRARGAGGRPAGGPALRRLGRAPGRAGGRRAHPCGRVGAHPGPARGRAGREGVLLFRHRAAQPQVEDAGRPRRRHRRGRPHRPAGLRRRDPPRARVAAPPSPRRQGGDLLVRMAGRSPSSWGCASRPSPAWWPRPCGTARRCPDRESAWTG